MVAEVAEPSSTAYSNHLYDEDLHVNVSLPQLFQRRIVCIVVPCSSLLEGGKLQNDDGERRFSPFQGQKPLRRVASDHRFAAVFCDQGSGLREIFLYPCHLPRC